MSREVARARLLVKSFKRNSCGDRKFSAFSKGGKQREREKEKYGREKGGSTLKRRSRKWRSFFFSFSLSLFFLTGSSGIYVLDSSLLHCLLECMRRSRKQKNRFRDFSATLSRSSSEYRVYDVVAERRRGEKERSHEISENVIRREISVVQSPRLFAHCGIALLRRLRMCALYCEQRVSVCELSALYCTPCENLFLSIMRV